MKPSLSKQDIIDMARHPKRVLAANVYEKEMNRTKTELTNAFRVYLDTLPNALYHRAGHYVFQVPIQLWNPENS